jgi:hypothetical protein
VVRDQGLEQGGVGEGGGAEHRSRRAGIEGSGDIVSRTQPPAGLHRHGHRLADPHQLLDVHGRPRTRAVQVDDVKRLRALLGPAPRRVDRVGVEGGLAVVVALHQPHGSTLADVDRRVEDHAAG